MSEPTLFDLAEPQTNKFIEPMLTPQERARRMNQPPRTEIIASPSQHVTSTLAALDAKPKMRGIKKQILDLLAEHPEGLTCSEFCQITGREKPSCSPRFVELEQKGLVRIDGVRPSNTGSLASIYKLT